MNIDDMTDQEKRDQKKSMMLARAQGWQVLDEPHNGELHDTSFWVSPSGESGVTLYHPTHMALAWLVHLWALNQDFADSYYIAWLTVGDGWADSQLWFYLEDAQRAWLDKILELASESGLIPD